MFQVAPLSLWLLSRFPPVGECPRFYCVEHESPKAFLSSSAGFHQSRLAELHQPRQRGRHDPCAIAPDDLGGACGLCFGQPASTRARQSAGATGCHEMEGWFRGMAVLFRMP